MLATTATLYVGAPDAAEPNRLQWDELIFHRLGGAMTTAPSKHQQALQAFQGDLPHLLNERPGQWVAYQATRQVGFALHKHELYQKCFAQGLDREEFVVFCIEPQLAEITLGPVVLD